MIPKNVIALVTSCLLSTFIFSCKNDEGNIPKEAPFVQITAPIRDTTLIEHTTLTINATATIKVGTIEKVEFFAGNTKLGEDSTAPYSYSWIDLPLGKYSLVAKAIDKKGNRGTSDIVDITVIKEDVTETPNGPVVLLGGHKGVYKASTLGEIFSASNEGLSSESLLVQAFLDKDNIIYAGTKGGVYKSVDNGNTWVASNNGMSGLGLDIVTLFEKDGVIYAGSFGGGLYKSSNGKDWSLFNTGLPSGALKVRTMVAHANNIYIGTHGGAYRLNSSSTAWESVSSGLNDESSLTVVSLVSWNNTLYAATFGGLLKELKSGSDTWVTNNKGLQDGFVNAIALVEDKLYVGGNTYGVFIYDGVSFKSFNNGLPSSNLPIRTFVVKGKQVLMSTINNGTYYTNNGSEWVANEGEPDNTDYWGLLLR